MRAQFRLSRSIAARATCLLLTCFAAACPALAGDAPPKEHYNLVMEASLPEAARLHLNMETKESGKQALRFPLVDGKLLAGIHAPPGETVLVYLDAEDSTGMPMFTGKAEIVAGKEFDSPQVIKLESVRGGGPAEITFASHRLVLEFAGIGSEKELTTRVTARLFDAAGVLVEMVPDDFSWEIDDPWIVKNAMPCKGANGPPPPCIEFGPTMLGFAVEDRFGVCYRGICAEEFPPVQPRVWRTVSAGLGNHACALKMDGSAWCWGQGFHGELGVEVPKACIETFHSDQPGTRPVACAPRPVQVQCPGAPCDFIEISAGVEHTCAIDRSQHGWCWGGNFMGERGDGTDDDGSGDPEPRRVNGNLNFSAISAGLHFTCGLTVPGQDVYCWGDNNIAVVPHITDTILREPAKVNLLNNANALSIDAGFIHVCAVVENGGLYCWGVNTSHVLGSGLLSVTPQCSNCPAFPRLMQFANITEIHDQDIHFASAGMSGTCAHLTMVGSIECWGGIPIPAVTPRRNLFAVSRGGEHYCALASSAAICAGLGNMGQLGDGASATAPSRRGPVFTKAPPVSFLQVSAGLNFTCAISLADKLYCWGANHLGSLGNGQPGTAREDFPSDVPVRVSIN